MPKRRLVEVQEEEDQASNSYSNPLSAVPRAPCHVDSVKDLPYIPTRPLPKKSFCMYIVGKPGSGKTNLWLSMMLSKKPRYYRKFFDRTMLVSGSMDTLPKAAVKGKFAVPPSQQYREINDETVDVILNELRSGDKNTNNLLILDDVIKDITQSRRLSHVFLNRRHITHDAEKEG
jgi:NB-ARC domain.